MKKTSAGKKKVVKTQLTVFGNAIVPSLKPTQFSLAAIDPKVPRFKVLHHGLCKGISYTFLEL